MSEAPQWSEMVSLPNILPSELVAGQTPTTADAEHPEETTSLIKQAEIACTGIASATCSYTHHKRLNYHLHG